MLFWNKNHRFYPNCIRCVIITTSGGLTINFETLFDIPKLSRSLVNAQQQKKTKEQQNTTKGGENKAERTGCERWQSRGKMSRTFAFRACLELKRLHLPIYLPSPSPPSLPVLVRLPVMTRRWSEIDSTPIEQFLFALFFLYPGTNAIIKSLGGKYWF